ncbi:hypothetical protein MK805_05505 [Shimazuella sp. AN120528]|nr:hypothetical protein [Shimazuella soli]MCH5584422.1 hypothetical protein [Shimazuella soli]
MQNIKTGMEILPIHPKTTGKVSGKDPSRLSINIATRAMIFKIKTVIYLFPPSP